MRTEILVDNLALGLIGLDLLSFAGAVMGNEMARSVFIASGSISVICAAIYSIYEGKLRQNGNK